MENCRGEVLKQAGACWLLVLVHLFWLLLACTAACPLPGSLWVSPRALPWFSSSPCAQWAQGAATFRCIFWGGSTHQARGAGLSITEGAQTQTAESSAAVRGACGG